MSHVDDGKLNALLDGELDATEAAAVNAHIASCAECARRLEEAKRFLTQAAELLGTLDVPPQAAAPARRVSKTAKEVALDVDGVTQQSPAIGAGAPDRLFHRGTRARPEHSGPDLSSLAWAAIIVLAIGVGFLANEVRHGREAAAPGQGETLAQRQAPVTAAPAGEPAAPAPEPRAEPAATGGRPPAAGTRYGPRAAKAAPGATIPIVTDRSVTGIGHKRIELPGRTVAARAVAPQPTRVAGAVVTAPTIAMTPSPAGPPLALRGGRTQSPPEAEGAAGASAASDAVVATAPPSPARPGDTFRRVTLEQAVIGLQGTIRLIDGMTSDHVEIGPGRGVPSADSARDVVRVIYGTAGQELVLDQQHLAAPDAGAANAPREAQLASALGPGDLVVTTSPDGLNALRWTDRGFWLSLSGHVPTDSLRRLADRVR